MRKRFPIGLENTPLLGRLGFQFPHLFDTWDRDFLPFWQEADRPLIPPVDMAEDKETLKVHIEMPGLKEDEIQVLCQGDQLVVKAKREEAKENDEADFHVRERRTGSYQRMIRLPFRVVDPDSIEARYQQGVLSLLIPKTREVQDNERPVAVHFGE